MPENTAAIAAGVSEAVSGPQTPTNVVVKRPSGQVIGTVFLALLVVVTGIAVVIGVLSYGPWWKDTEAVALSRIHGLKWIGWLLCADVVLLVFAIVSPWVGRVEASAGENRFTLEGRDTP